MPLNIRRKIGESIDIDDSVRIFVEDILFDPVNRESSIALRVVERDTGGQIATTLYEREETSMTVSGQPVVIKLLHVMSPMQCLVQVAAPQAIRILRSELLNRGEHHE